MFGYLKQKIFLLLFFIGAPFPSLAKTYSYYANGYQVKLTCVKHDSILHIDYSIYNTSPKDLYYSGNYLVTSDSISDKVELGSFHYAKYIMEGSVFLKKLVANDSVKVSFESKINLNSKGIVISFDCLSMSKLRKKQREKILRTLEPSLNNDSFNLDFSVYTKYYTDWFKLQLPE